MSTYRRMSVDVQGRDSGFTAMLNRMNAGLSRVGMGLRSSGRDAGLFSNQIKAIGTTARYYLAGQLVFGVMSAVNSLGEFKTQLGSVDALASQIDRNGNLQGLGDQLNDVGSQAILMSNKFGVAVEDVESYMQRFFSSFNPPGTAKQRVAEMESYTTAILQLTASLGSEAGDPQKLAGGLTGLINAVPGGRRHPGRTAGTIADYFAVLLRETPSLTGADIAGAAGRFASAKSLARMTVPQILSTFGVAAQTGGSPSVIIRGITQLLGQSLLHPTRPQSLQTYQAANLPTDPNALASMGGQAVLEKLITYVQSGGPQGSAGRRQNLDAIYNAFSRQESVRQFVNLIAQGGVPALRRFNGQLQEGAKNHMAAQMADRRLRQSTLIRMQQARHNLGISVVGSGDWAIEHLIADPMIGISNFDARHRTTTQGVLAGGIGLGAANALRRLGAFKRFGGRFGKLGKFIGAASSVEQAAISGAISKEELPAAIAGGKTDGTRANPFWVIISPLSWSVGSPGGFSSPNPNMPAEQKLLDDAKKIGRKGAVPFGAAWRAIGIGGAATISAALAVPGAVEHVARLFYGPSRAVPAGHPLLSRYAKAESAMHPGDSLYVGQLNPKTRITPQVEAVLDKFAMGKMSADRAETLLRRMQPGAAGNPIHVTGSTEVDINVTTKHPDGTTSRHRQRAHIDIIPVKSYPTAKGKPRARKGGK